MNEVSDWMAKYQAERANAYQIALQNRREIHATLHSLGAKTVTCTYSGYGDSGQIDDTNIDGIDIGKEMPEVMLTCLDEKGDRVVHPQGLMNALTDMFYTFLEHHHPGYENNDGGQGEFIWDVKENTISLDHGDNYVQTEHTSHEF